MVFWSVEDVVDIQSDFDRVQLLDSSLPQPILGGFPQNKHVDALVAAGGTMLPGVPALARMAAERRSSGVMGCGFA